MAAKPKVELTDKLKRAVLERIAKGESLRSVCRDEAMPDFSQIMRLRLDDESFANQYARSREIQAEKLADEIFDICDDESKDVTGELEMPNGVAVQRSRLRVDTRKWYLSKVLPKIYGEKVVHQGDETAPLVVRHIGKTE